MIGNRLKQLREEKGLKQEELAKFLSVSTSAIGMYERNAREPNNALTIKICNFFDCSIDYLMGITNIRKPIDGLNTSNLSEENKKELYNIYEYMQNQKELDKIKNNDLIDLKKQLQKKDISTSQIEKLISYLSNNVNKIATYEFEEFLSTLNPDVIDFITDFNFKSSLNLLQNVFEKQKFRFKYKKEIEGLTDEEITNALQFYKEMKKKVKGDDN